MRGMAKKRRPVKLEIWVNMDGRRLHALRTICHIAINLEGELGTEHRLNDPLYILK